ncbi:DUF5348 domain-containing protein [Ktedonosporobacter rubrisoli]|uniref:DUF5348 domain-containing protein n=1 Tax=Ktedonosporobacter rubrisoli TaxID=2509675 RepID=UPI0013EE95E2
MAEGKLVYDQQRAHLMLHGSPLQAEDLIELYILGHWVPGRVYKDVSGWYIVTSAQVGLRLQEGLLARFPEASSPATLPGKKTI